jgi:hypothetical protein
VHARLTRQQRGEFLTTPLGMAGAVLEWVLVAQVIAMVRQGLRHFWRAAGPGALGEAGDPVVGEAMHPCAEGSIRKRSSVAERYHSFIWTVSV